MEHVVNNLLDDPSVGGIVVNSRDVTERRLLQERLENEATHNPLTGLPNRALFVDRLERALILASRHDRQVVVLFVDLDGFKPINESLGHQAGDRLLLSVADRLGEAVRPRTPSPVSATTSSPCCLGRWPTRRGREGG